MEMKDTKITAMLYPQSGNPRNSEGSFLHLDDGRIAFAYSRYVGDSDLDHAKCEIACIYSYDNGETFDTEHVQTLVRATEYGQENVMSVTLRRMQNGDIGLFFLLKIMDTGIRNECYLRRYKGDFDHFLQEIKVAPRQYTGYYVINNDRFVQLSSGRWIVMAAVHQSKQATDEEGFSIRNLEWYSTSCAFISDDDGYTWRQTNQMLSINAPSSISGLQEPGCVELPGGVVYGYFRTDLGRQYESVSLDGGLRWYTPQPSQFSSPCSPMLIKRSNIDGKYYAVWNPIPEHMGRHVPVGYWHGGRNPLVIADSDDGVHFSKPVVLEEDETRGFCYPAMYFVEDGILLAYCSGGKEDGACLNRTTIRRVYI